MLPALSSARADASRSPVARSTPGARLRCVGCDGLFGVYYAKGDRPIIRNHMYRSQKCIGAGEYAMSEPSNVFADASLPRVYHGGKRKGAGRPPTTGSRSTPVVSFRLSAKVYELLRLESRAAK